MDVNINSFLGCFIIAMQLISIDGEKKEIFSAMLATFRYTRIINTNKAFSC